MLPAIDSNQFPRESSFPPCASSSTFSGCAMDESQPRDDPMPIDDTASAPQGGSSLPLPAESGIFRGDAMCGGQLIGEPMLIDRVFPIFNGGSSFPLQEAPSTLDIPTLERQVEAIPMSVDDVDPNSSGT